MDVDLSLLKESLKPKYKYETLSYRLNYIGVILELNELIRLLSVERDNLIKDYPFGYLEIKD